MSKDTKCLNPNCPKPATVRGLCSCCYSTARRLLREGAVKEDDLIKAGKINPPHIVHVASCANWLKGVTNP